MLINSLTLSFSVIAKSDYAIAVNAAPFFNYVDGKKSGDTPAGIRLDVILPSNRFERISVKVPGMNHPLTPENFKETEASFKVKFSPDFEGKFYQTPSGDYGLTCRASSFELIK